MRGVGGSFDGRNENKILIARLPSKDSSGFVRVVGGKEADVTTEEQSFPIPPKTDFEILGSCEVKFIKG